MSLALENKTILITGASRGIGREAALRFAKEGATVILMARDEDKLNAIYDEIVANGCPEPFMVPFDFEKSPEESYLQLRNGLAEHFPQIDGLLLNASQLGARTPISNYNWQTWKKVMTVNVDSQFLLVKSLLPLMEDVEDGSILFTSSSVGREGRAYWGAYSVSKFATEALMQILAQELENTSNIRVNSINPGATRTDMRVEAYPAEDPTTVKEPKELMDQYVKVMSTAGKDINGKALNFES